MLASDAVKRHVYLRSDDLELRPLSDNQAELYRILHWRNDLDTRRWLFNSDVIERDAHLQWYARYCEDPNDLMWVILWHGKPVGTTALYNIEPTRAEYGRLIIGEPEARGHGLAQRASILVHNWAFETLNLDYIYGVAKADNVVALHVNACIGFQVEKEADGLVYLKLPNPTRSK